MRQLPILCCCGWCQIVHLPLEVIKQQKKKPLILNNDLEDRKAQIQRHEITNNLKNFLCWITLSQWCCPFSQINSERLVPQSCEDSAIASGMGKMVVLVMVDPWLCKEACFGNLVTETDFTLWHVIFDVQVGVCFLDIGENMYCLFSEILLLCFFISF